MKKYIIPAIVLAIPAVMAAQSAVDAYTLSRTETRGTARFMAMGGAFTALGGDLSTLNQNPAGIGVYRRSEVGVTLDISPQSVTSRSSQYVTKTTSTPVSCNNFGYIGTVNLGGALETFSWGASYNRVTSFNRKFSAYERNPGTSLTNYIAAYTTASGILPSSMDFNDNKGYNPYFDSDADWLSILAYSAYMINPTALDSYRGLWQNGTDGDSYSVVNESGYVDEYSIDFGGNVSDKFMWGIGFGITDLRYNRLTYYSESMENAYVATANGSMTNGNAGYELVNRRTMTGTGFNLKLGLIFKPVNELRIGFAFHTPTWYTITNNAYAEVDYSYLDPSKPESESNPLAGYDYTEDSYYNFRMTSPLKVMAGAAVVLGSSAIISADYEYQSYNKIKTSYQGQFGQYYSDDNVNFDIKQYYKAANIFRLGVEYRVIPSFSVRAGYNYTSTTSSDYMLDGGEVLTSGTDPSYSMDRAVNAVSAGLGYRYKAFYADATYVYRNKKSTFKPYTDYGQVKTPTFALNENTNSIVLSVGFKF